MKSRSSSLGGRFLWLTVPVFLVSAALLLVFLARQRVNELRELATAQARQQLERDAGLLSLPMWDLDFAAADALGASAVSSGRAVCALVRHAAARSEDGRFGDCRQRGDLSAIVATVLAPGGVEVIGELEYWADTRVRSDQLLAELRPQLMMLGLLVAALVACVMIAFRRIIIRPLAQAESSIRAYHERGEYRPVPYQAADELGAFVREFNAGLARQQAFERELTAQLAFQHTLNTTLPLPLAVLDGAMHLIETNPAFGRAFELPPSAGLLALGAVVPELEQAPIQAVAEGAVHEQEIVHRHPDGGARHYQVACSRLPADRERGGWLLVFQDVTSRIESARALEAAFADTRRTLLELQQAQESLIQAEKLASLGAVVAGIAHEVNTPVGSSLTVASALVSKVDEFRGQMQGGTLRRSALTEFVDEVGEAGQILQRGLTRAADQIAKFKQVAADQTSSQRREFELATVVEEVLSVLRPGLRGRQVEVKVAIDPEIRMDSYPGPLGQVITNLFTNALQHGFDGRERGCIEISAQRSAPGWVALQVRDDGGGIDAEHKARVFDPFFTTKLGRGGTGLGLNLVYTMVSNVLGGTVAVESERGHGTRFMLELPCNAPLTADREGDRRSNA